MCDFRVVNIGDGRQPASRPGFGQWPMRLASTAAVPVAGGRSLPLDAFRDRRVHAVAGIAHPALLRHAARARHRVVPHAFADHQAYQPQDLSFGSQLPVLMTEKDAVKCRAFADGAATRCRCAPSCLPRSGWR
jgi:tetraacyldisaccharide 4'-kinase